MEEMLLAVCINIIIGAWVISKPIYQIAKALEKSNKKELCDECGLPKGTLKDGYCQTCSRINGSMPNKNKG